MRMTVVGAGYVGLVVGACLAETGNEVTCVDVDEARIRSLRADRLPIYEPGLDELVRRNAAKRRLAFDTALERSARDAEVVFIAVGTPSDEDGSADVQHVLRAARDVGRAMDGYTVVALKSTVPVGTAERVQEAIGEETTEPFSVVSNPEFLKQGSAVDDFLKPDRVVIGAGDERAARLMVSIYKPFTRTGAPIEVMDRASAELSKYAANAMLATRVSFMNEVANVCDATTCAVSSPPTGASVRPSCSPGSATAGAAFPRTSGPSPGWRGTPTTASGFSTRWRPSTPPRSGGWSTR